MKQTDKCECGHSKDKHKGIEELKCFYRNKNNRYCLCNKFKSHSQKECCVCEGYNPNYPKETYYCKEHKNFKSHSPNPDVTESKVRASEEKTIGKTSDTTQSFGVSSSVPYTPLTKEKSTYNKVYNSWTYLENDVFSALNGLRKDDNIELFDILNTLLHSRIDKNVKERIMNKIEIILNNKNKWFLILKDDEVI